MMIVNESAPLGDSINSSIDPEDKHVFYTDFKSLCELLKRIGDNGWLWVIDAVDAYYRIPIQKRFQHLFGIIWLNKLLIYKCLSFGLSTAPSIYNKFADLILWTCTYWRKKTFKCNGKFNILHYLDDFFGGHQSYQRANAQKEFLIAMFKYLNIPTNPKKVVGPTQIADILGWSCRTFPTVQIGLAESKRVKYMAFINHLIENNSVTFKQLEKVVGYTRHTCRVYLEGNKFVRGLERQKYAIGANINDPTSSVTKYTKFNLSPEAMFDLKIWLQLYSDKKYRYLDIDFINKPDTLPTINVFTDASTSYGAGGYTSLGNLFHLPWYKLQLISNMFKNRYNNVIEEHIIYLELFSLVLMAYTHAKNWKNKFIHFWCDNMTVVKAVNKGTLNFGSKLYYPKANLIKLLARLALKYDFHFECHHIEGEKNKIADILSRSNDYLRNKIYSKLNKPFYIPFKIASKIINCTCVDHFSLGFDLN